jgi:hypothetical protein
LSAVSALVSISSARPLIGRSASPKRGENKSYDRDKRHQQACRSPVVSLEHFLTLLKRVVEPPISPLFTHPLILPYCITFQKPEAQNLFSV